MTIALWCVLAAILMPYILSVLARSAAGRADYVGDPRAYSEGLGGWHRRAHLAHLNAFEAVPAITAAVLVAELVRAPQPYVDGLALAFVAFRLLHALFYISDRPSRSTTPPSPPAALPPILSRSRRQAGLAGSSSTRRGSAHCGWRRATGGSRAG